MDSNTTEMSFEEMTTRWPGEWVLIDQPVLDEQLLVKRGRVVFHSQDRAEVHARVVGLPAPRFFAVEYLGSRPIDMEFLL